MLYSVLSRDKCLGDIFVTLAVAAYKFSAAEHEAYYAAKKEYDLATDAAVKEMYYNQMVQIATEAGALQDSASSDKTKTIIVYSCVAFGALLLSFFLTRR